MRTYTSGRTQRASILSLKIFDQKNQNLPKTSAEDLSKEINSKDERNCGVFIALSLSFPHISHSTYTYLRIMSALSMTTAVTAKDAIAGKSVVSKRNVAAAPSKRGQFATRSARAQLEEQGSIFLLSYFSARFRRGGAILFLAALCGIFSL